MDEDDVRRIAAESAELTQRFFGQSAALLLEIGARIAEGLRSGSKLLAFGNGGSAADAQHLAAELVGRYRRERPGLPALALTTDPSIVTALANDYGYDQVFRRQVEAHGRAGDFALGFTTSGRSPSVLEALRSARERGLVTVALTGEGGGAAAGIVDYLIAVPHLETARVQEIHGMVVHVLCQIVEDAVLA
jgi:D-sedoheptulose 7-phosphate isomerase